jgi:hypothetical protein
MEDDDDDDDDDDDMRSGLRSHPALAMMSLAPPTRRLRFLADAATDMAERVATNDRANITDELGMSVKRRREADADLIVAL